MQPIGMSVELGKRGYRFNRYLFMKNILAPLVLLSSLPFSIHVMGGSQCWSQAQCGACGKVADLAGPAGLAACAGKDQIQSASQGARYLLDMAWRRLASEVGAGGSDGAAGGKA